MDKEYRFSVIIADSTGVYLVDYGKFRGNFQVFTSVLGELNVEDLNSLATVYMVKSNTCMTKELGKFTPVAKDHIDVASIIVHKAMKEDKIVKSGIGKLFNEYYESVEKPFMRVGMTVSTKQDGFTIFASSDKEVIGMQSLFMNVFDARKKRARKSNNVLELC